jgi:hypothetical protein
MHNEVCDSWLTMKAMLVALVKECYSCFVLFCVVVNKHTGLAGTNTENYQISCKLHLF